MKFEGRDIELGKKDEKFLINALAKAFLKVLKDNAKLKIDESGLAELSGRFGGYSFTLYRELTPKEEKK